MVVLLLRLISLGAFLSAFEPAFGDGLLFAVEFVETSPAYVSRNA
jgi:hypothetical protein